MYQSGENKSLFQNMCPTFNKDGLHYTPAFENDDDRIKTEFDKKVHLYLHNDRINSELAEIDETEIMVPRPSERNSYCTICKERF